MMSASSRLAPVVALLVLGNSADVQAQAAPADKWKLLPAAPTTCFSDDDFHAKLDAARAAIQAEVERQTKVNAEARARFDAMDMGEKAQRMQAFMMKNPQEAMKMMQAGQAAGAAVHSSVPRANEASKRLDAELELHVGRFRAAAEEAIKPVLAKRGALIKARGVEVGEVGAIVFKDPAAHAQYVALIDEENAAYAKACAPYFGAGGTFHEWLQSYKAEVVDVIVANLEANDAAIVMQMAAMELPGGGYRSIAALEQSLPYLVKVRNVFDVRRATTRPSIPLVK